MTTLTSLSNSQSIHCNNKKKLNLSYPQNIDVLSQKGFDIAMYYIPYHLRGCVQHENLRGLPKHFLIPPQQPAELFQIVANLCQRMESQNSSFFENLPEKINLKLENAKTLFLKLCQETFSDNIINWGRVISVFTLAGTFAVFFANKNQTSVIVKIPHWVLDFVEQYLSDWISQQGGWGDLVDKLYSQNTSPSWCRLFAYGGVVAAAGCLILSRGIGK